MWKRVECPGWCILCSVKLNTISGSTACLLTGQWTPGCPEWPRYEATVGTMHDHIPLRYLLECCIHRGWCFRSLDGKRASVQELEDDLKSSKFCNSFQFL